MRSVNLPAAVVGLLIAAGSLPALAYENFDKGKSPPQLFVSDCGGCHHSAAGLGAELDPRALSSFLAEHYTASADTADQLAGYLVSVRGSAAASRKARAAAPQEPSHKHGKTAKRRHVAKPRAAPSGKSGSPNSSHQARAALGSITARD